MTRQAFNDGLLDFLNTAPTPFHAVAEMGRRLEAAGFEHLPEGAPWSVSPGGRYFVTRNRSSIVAFRLGAQSPMESGVRMVGAHTDSPCLKVKPQPEVASQGYLKLGVEVYGGALLNPWFDRDLSLAGRVSFRTEEGQIKSALIDFGRPIAVIPSLAIHLDREVNEQRSINSQKDLPPVLMQLPDDKPPSFRELLLEQLHREHPGTRAAAVLDFELSLYDCQPAAVVGWKEEFITGARLDNLLSCYLGLQALLEAGAGPATALLVCNDHEEVGSVSACGADGPFLRSVLERLCGDGEGLSRAMDRSMLISADNAHGIHPNFADRHDEQHGPRLNQGPVIKINANQRYASNSETSALFRHLAEELDVPVQTFVVRTDMACGSTIGPLTASALGVRTLDLGVPQFAMHSIREMAGIGDGHLLKRVLVAFYDRPTLDE